MDAILKGKTRPALLSLVDSYAEDYVPKSLDVRLPNLISDLFNKAHLQASISESEMLVESSLSSYTCTEGEVEAAEELTRDQASSKV